MNKENLKHLLNEVFPGECQSVGPELLDELVSGKVSFERPEHGRRFDLPDLETLKEALEIVKILLGIFGIVKSKKKRRPKANEIAEAVEGQGVERQRVSDEEMTSLIEHVATSQEGNESLNDPKPTDNVGKGDPNGTSTLGKS